MGWIFFVITEKPLAMEELSGVMRMIRAAAGFGTVLHGEIAQLGAGIV